MQRQVFISSFANRFIIETKKKKIKHVNQNFMNPSKPGIRQLGSVSQCRAIRKCKRCKDEKSKTMSTQGKVQTTAYRPEIDIIHRITSSPSSHHRSGDTIQHSRADASPKSESYSVTAPSHSDHVLLCSTTFCQYLILDRRGLLI